MLRLIIFSFICFCLSCSPEKQANALFKRLPDTRTNISFSNELPIGLDLNILNYMYYYNGGGLGVGDLNNDGLMDCVFSSNTGAEKVYLNKGDLKFQDVSDQVQVDGGPNSWTNGVSIADVNGDGYLDIYLSQVGTYRKLDCKNRLFICQSIDENGVPSYKESAAEYGIDFQGFSTQAGFFDYDNDNDLDMFLMNHSLHHNGTFGQRSSFLDTYDEESGDRLYENQGGKFVDVTKSSGIHSSVIGYGLGLAFGDVNNDGWTDVYVGNDFHENDYLYINQGDGTFKDECEKRLKHTSRFSMGVDIVDIDNDDDQDIISLDMLPEDPVILKRSEGEDALDIFNFKLRYGYNHQYARNALQLNQGDGNFQEIGAYSGVHATDWSWTPLFFDMDMDGIQDLFVSNGIPRRMNDIDYINFISGNDVQYKIQFDHLEQQDLSVLEKIPEIKLNNYFYKGNKSLQFKDIGDQVGQAIPSFSNSAAYADFDNDGDYDLVCNNIGDQAFFYENLSQKKSVRLDIKGPSGNAFGFGAKIQAEYLDKTISRECHGVRGFQSSMMPQIIVPEEGLQQVSIAWPGGLTETIRYQGDSLIVLDHSHAKHKPVVEKESNSGISSITRELHQENKFVEFNREPLIPFSTSSHGPALAIGDVNNDGLDDYYIGSSKRNKSQLFFQNKDGSMTEVQLKGMPADSIYEEVDALFYDLNKDGYEDLIIATGGNEYRLNSPYTKPLLYWNRKGQLERDESAFQDIHLTASTIAIDEIEDQTYLFFGGRAYPRSYGTAPSSYLLRYNSVDGTFENVSQSMLPNDGQLGFVRDAEFGDVNGDGKSNLVVAAEWAPITIYSLDGDAFVGKEIDDRKGWWNSVNLFDMDGDGDQDIFAGNLGLNSRLKASKEESVKMYFNDFDDNDVKEQVLTYYVAGREIPFSNMMELQKQIPNIKKRFVYANDFAKSSISQIFGADKIKSSEVFEANHFETTLYKNDSGNFKAMELPKEVQYSTVNTVLSKDINGDGIKDLFLGSNFHYCNVQMGRYDADNGSYLLSNKDGNYTHQFMLGTPLKGQVNKLSIINIKGEEYLAAAQNSDSLTFIKLEF